MEFDDVNRYGSCHYAVGSRIVDFIVSHPQDLPPIIHRNGVAQPAQNLAGNPKLI